MSLAPLGRSALQQPLPGLALLLIQWIHEPVVTQFQQQQLLRPKLVLALCPQQNHHHLLPLLLLAAVCCSAQRPYAPQHGRQFCACGTPQGVCGGTACSQSQWGCGTPAGAAGQGRGNRHNSSTTSGIYVGDTTQRGQQERTYGSASQ